MNNYSYSILRAALLLVSLFLAACASTGPAPVDDLSGGIAQRGAPQAASPAARSTGSYQVVRGDTLYSIAFRNGLDYRDLAGWNGIGAPYTIYVGQQIQLAPASAATTTAAPKPVVTTSAAVAQTAPLARPTPAPMTAPAPFEDVGSTPPPAAPVEKIDPPAPASTAAVAAASTPAPVATPASPPPPVAPPPVAAPPAAATGGDPAWRWPADGPIVGSYVAGDQTRQGIDIGGKVGNPVRASSAGTVVYSGNGLIGYGELIIVKHSPAFLSAYGHNSKRLVKEGDRVSAGQTIAEMGSSSASRDSLHFEIRKNGKPVNPMDYLPRR